MNMQSQTCDEFLQNSKKVTYCMDTADLEVMRPAGAKAVAVATKNNKII